MQSQNNQALCLATKIIQKRILLALLNNWGTTLESQSLEDVHPARKPTKFNIPLNINSSLRNIIQYDRVAIVFGD